jgi:hypothetical protein
VSPPQDSSDGHDCSESDLGDSGHIEDDIIPSSQFGEKKATEYENDSSLHLASSPLANVGCGSADEVDNRSVDGCPRSVHAQADRCDDLISKNSTGTSADLLDIDTDVLLSTGVQSISGAQEPAMMGVSNISKSHVPYVAQGPAVLPIIEEVGTQAGIHRYDHVGGNVSLSKSEEVEPKIHSKS